MRDLRQFSLFMKSVGLFVILLAVVTSCKEKDPEPVKPKADFATASATVAENAGTATTVTINFDGDATADGTITVSMAGGTYTTDYVTSPNGLSGSLDVAFTSGAPSASFTVTPVDDTEENASKVITFTLSAAVGGVELGTEKTYTLTITDNDIPSAVEFDAATGTVAENATEALVVNLSLSTAAVNAGTFDVAIASGDATYTTHYTTTPDGSSGSFTVDVAAEASSASFSVTPIDNGDNDGDKTIVFTISNPTGGVNLGAATTYTLTITNDDTYTLKTIAEIRAMYSGTDVNVTEDFAIQGIVTSRNDAVTGRNLFIQDATAGIAIRWSVDHSFAQGDELLVLMNGSTLSDYADLVQITGTMPLENGGTAFSTGNTVTPATITLTELNSDSHQGQLVTVTGVNFTQADGLRTFSGNNTISNGSVESAVRVESYAPFSGDAIPLGSGDITGIVGIFSGTNQILPQERTDVYADNPAGTITLTQSITDFGSVESGSSSVSQSYTVDFDGTITEVVVEASANYEVSLDDADFSVNPVTVSTTGATVYVRFSPTAGTGGVIGGTLTHTATGAIAKVIDLSGTETLANPPIYSETFETDGNGTRYTTSVTEFTDAGGDYFLRTDGSDIGSWMEFTGTTGFFFAAQDTDGDGNPTSVTLDIAGIDISGKTNLQVMVSIAEDESTDGNEDWDDVSEFIIEYQIDGGGYQTLLSIQAKELRPDASVSTSNKAPAVDTNGDGYGDGTEITDTFAEFVMDLASTGTTLDLRFNMINLKNGDEDIAFDNIKVVGD